MVHRADSRTLLILLALVSGAGSAYAQGANGTALGAIQTWEAKREGVYFRVACGEAQATALISALSSKIIRIQIATDEAHIATEVRGEGIEASENDDSVLLSVSRLVLTLSKQQFGVTIGVRDGGVLFDCSSAAGRGIRFGVPMRGSDTPLAAAEFATTETEHFYGLGAKFNSLDQQGERAEMWVRTPFDSINDESSICVPFFLSSRGYGLWLDSSARAAFEFGRAREGKAQIVVASPKLDLYFILGPAPAEVIGHYTELTGRSPLPPPWAFLPWVSAGSYDRQEDVLSAAARMREENIPCGVIVIDRWQGDPFYKFDADRFPDPEGMLRELRQNNYHCLLTMIPFVYPRDATGQAAGAAGHFALDEDGEPATLRGGFGLVRQFRGWAVVDFSDPDAGAWWADVHRPLLGMGVEGFMTHGAEVIPSGMVFVNALTGAEMHNLYPNLYNGTVSDFVRRETEGRGLVWARSGFAGIQRYPVVSAGSRKADWANLRGTITAGLSAGMSGMPFWGHDIGGYAPTPDRELYVRWAQLGAFSPMMQLHGRDACEPWRYDEEVLRIFRKYATVRANLIPYIYSIARQAAETGMPLMRPLALVYPQDEQAAQIDDEYLFGPALLVAPVSEPAAASRQVYLPEGQWIDFWENTIYSGPGRITRAAPLDTIPVFVRADSILPMDLVRGRSPGDDLRAEPELTLDVYPLTRARFGVLDRGTTIDVQAERSGPDLRLLIGNRKRQCVVRVLCGNPKDVQVTGLQIPPITSRRIASYDARTQRLLIRPAGHQRVTITISGAGPPVLFANINYPLTVCSAEPEMAVEADVLNLAEGNQPTMSWTDSARQTGEVLGTRVADTEARWRFVAPLPGPMATGGYMRFRLLGGAASATSPSTQTRQTDLTPPVDVQLAIGGARMAGKQPVPVNVTIANNSRRTATGTVRLSTYGNARIAPADTQEYTAPALGAKSQVRFDVTFPPELPVGEHRVTAQVKWQDLDMRPAMTAVTKQPTWAIIGPFDNADGRGLTRPYAPEKALNINAPVRGKGNKFVTWRRYPSERLAHDGMLDFRAAYPDESWALAYATAWIESPEQREVTLRTGNSFPLLVWLNGKEVLRQRQYRVARRDQDSRKVRLQRGRNVILVKAAGRQAQENWQVYFRITGADEGELTDLVDLGARAFGGLSEAKLAD